MADVLQTIFDEAVRDFVAHEYLLVRKNAHEQAFCGRLARYVDHSRIGTGWRTTLWMSNTTGMATRRKQSLTR